VTTTENYKERRQIVALHRRFADGNTDGVLLGLLLVADEIHHVRRLLEKLVERTPANGAYR
jgi:hypothetical protein